MKLRVYRNKYGEWNDEVLLNRQEQKAWFEMCVSKVLFDTRYCLDNLESFKEFKVGWENYQKNQKVYK